MKRPEIIVEFDYESDIADFVKDIRKPIQKFIFGTYSDGRIRNMVDALRGEYLSPKQKKALTKKKKKKYK